MTKPSILKPIFIFVLATIFFLNTLHSALANWNHVSYMQADNNLAPFAEFNVREMLKVNLHPSINVLLEWDKPNDNTTWRYQVINKKLLNAGTFTGTHDLGANPVQELIDMVKWAKALTLKKYNALRWCINLWNHGYGILDPRLKGINRTAPGQTGSRHLPWLMIPGMPYGEGDFRGILFDDSQNTYVTAAGLTRAVKGMRDVIGNKIDLMSMDACLMAMIEVGYQIKGLVDILVAAENTEPGNGHHYAAYLSELSANPTMSAEQLATSIVQTYGRFYAGKDSAITLSAIKIDALIPLKNNLMQLMTAINACYATDAASTRAAVRQARAKTMVFEIPDYIDLLSFYNRLNREFATKTTKPKPKQKPKPKPNQKPVQFSPAATNVCTIIAAGIPLIRAAVVANTVGRDYAGAGGISIYFPRGPVDSSYRITQFAQDTGWDKFIAKYR
ncbi:hypothetical protein FJ365_04055 [Candidatus Dependentiae bacterium]|nr:hypothetical protein [Candidatus Dependentiae bacterium]